MIRIFTPAIFAFISINLTPYSANSQTTYVDYGSSNTYTLYAGDSLYIKTGTFSGTINNWVQGAKITVASGATFKPSNFDNFRGSFLILGTAIIPAMNTLAGFDLKNYGNLTINGSTQMNSAAQTWNNYYGATITFKSSVSLNTNGGIFNNHGIISAKVDFNIYSNSTFTNYNNITIDGNFNMSQGYINNYGKFYTIKTLTINGAANFTNTCRMIADKGISINNSSATVYNNGLMWATNSVNDSWITNNGTIYGSTGSKVKSVTFTNYGKIKGSGYFYFTGSTTGSGTIGTSGTTSDSLYVYDVTRTNPPKIFDTQWGTVYANTAYRIFSAPDTSNSYPNCYAESTAIPLPIKWNYFYASLSDNVPLLDWSADQDPGTVYEVQRSYDGNNFTSISSIKSEINKTVYQYSDNRVDSKINIIYYRIKAIEPTGELKYSVTRPIKFDNQSNISIHTTPNPFTSQFSISYQATENATLAIKIYSMSGQLQTSKTAMAGKGNNTILITEAANIAKGIYAIQVSSENNLIATERIVKQ